MVTCSWGAGARREAAATVSRAREAAGWRRRTDAARRLAGEEDQLADRARKLQQALRRSTADDSARSREGRRPISGQAVADGPPGCQADAAVGGTVARRGVARDGPADPNGNAQSRAGVQQDLAKQLDRLADKLSAASGEQQDQSTKLSGQLARAQELREQLDRATRALAEAGRQGERAMPGGSSQKTPGDRGRTGQGRQGAGGTDFSKLNEDSLRQLR